MTAVDKELLFKPRLVEDEVEIPGVGTVRVRALSRQEAKQIQKLDSADQRDLHMIALGLVEPRLSVSEVKRWAEASPAGEMEPVSDRIAALSGLSDDSPKQAVKEFQADPDAEFRVLPGPEAVDDGGPAADGDE